MNYLLLLSLIGCPESGKDSEDTGATTDTGDSTDTSSDTADTTDTADTADSAEPVVTSLSWDYTESSITTRNALSVVVTAHYEDGSMADVTASTTLTSTDESVVKSYAAGSFQPINAGVATIGAVYESQSLSGSLTVTVVPATNADLVFNEVLADGTVDGDPNGDGVADPVQDEFLEIANLSNVTVDLSGCTIIEDDFYTGLPRHTFAEGTILRAGEAIVVFGGGDVSSLSAANVQFVAAVNGDSGLEYGLSLNNEGEHVDLLDPTGGILASFAYGGGTDLEAIEDASMVLSPEVFGTSYTHHSYVAGSAGDFSAGTYADGSPFPGPDGRY